MADDIGATLDRLVFERDIAQYIDRIHILPGQGLRDRRDFCERKIAALNQEFAVARNDEEKEYVKRELERYRKELALIEKRLGELPPEAKPTPPAAAVKALKRKLPTPNPPSSWAEVSMYFMNESSVRIKAKDSERNYEYSDMGFADGRQGGPIKAWGALRKLAASDVPIQMDKAIAYRINKKLRAHFSTISGNPLTHRKGKGYHCEFCLSLARSYSR